MEVVACQDRVDHVSITLDGLKLEERFHRGLKKDANRRIPCRVRSADWVALARAVVVADLLRLRREAFELDAARFEDAFARRLGRSTHRI